MRVNNKVKLQQAEKEAARWKYLAEAKNREVQSLKGALDSVGEDARAKVKGSERFIIALMKRLGSSEVRIGKEELAKADGVVCLGLSEDDEYIFNVEGKRDDL